MTRAESFGESLWASESLPEDVGALLGAFLESPIAASVAALIIVLFIGVALLGRIGAPLVGPTSGPPGPGAASRETSAPTQAKHFPLSSSANFLRALMKDRDQAAKELRHYGRGSGSSFYFRRDNAVQPLAKVERPQVLDLRSFGARSNASLERGPPDEGILNSIAGRDPSKWYPALGTRKVGLR
jgi:hypothetical protein